MRGVRDWPVFGITDYSVFFWSGIHRITGVKADNCISTAIKTVEPTCYTKLSELWLISAPLTQFLHTLSVTNSHQHPPPSAPLMLICTSTHASLWASWRYTVSDLWDCQSSRHVLCFHLHFACHCQLCRPMAVSYTIQGSRWYSLIWILYLKSCRCRWSHRLRADQGLSIYCFLKLLFRCGHTLVTQTQKWSKQHNQYFDRQVIVAVTMFLWFLFCWSTLSYVL